MSIDLSQFHQVFFEEAAEHLASMETLLLALNLASPAPDDLNAIFRAAHSIKGGSGTFGFTDMTEVTHVVETLLDKVRKGELTLTAEMVDACLAAGDVLKAQLSQHQGGPAVEEELVRDIVARLEALASGSAKGRADAGAKVRYGIECTLTRDCAGEAACVENLLSALKELGDCQLLAPASAENPRLALWLDTEREPAAIREVLEFYAPSEEIRIEAQPAAADEGGGEAWGLFAEAPGAPAPKEEAGAAYGFFSDAPGAPALKEEAGEGFGFFTDAPGAPEGSQAAQSAAVAAPSPASAQTPAGAKAAEAKDTRPRPVAAVSLETSSIRVSVEKVDQLINLVGELVITQAMLAQSASILDPVHAERVLAGIDLLSRNTRDLQEAVMSIRMLPMSTVFSRFPRVVRDLAKKLGKEVELKTIGESTELDKGLIEKITDPLTHLVRNSLDHGIEAPEVREAAGKPRKGTLTLKASHQGGKIVIEVMDDGAGLNRARILAKARERGLPVSDAMGDAEVWQLIFAPGFSTAEAVTEVSGRGVGMDVVKRNIEALGGRVELESSPGFGTRVVISLPLTLAILDGMSVRVGSETYIVPLTVVVESLQPRREDIRTIAGQGRVVAIRGEYLPLIPLAEVFAVPGALHEASEGILVVVEGESGKAALQVDELLGQHQVVIKSLETNYRKVEGISGATIMGDGRVAMILDVSALTRMGLRLTRQAKAPAETLPA
ncbi:MAG: chemotaxis protein CheW [Burkholderiales bacterium]|nr:chemotaxis protein CheW [Burkholderiales bacterium]